MTFCGQWLSRESSQEVVRASDKLDEVEIQTADISSRFKFFEGYREPEKKRKQFRITPPREGQVKVVIFVCLCIIKKNN
jgi:hypothetical protein